MNILIVSPASPGLRPLTRLTEPNKREYSYWRDMDCIFPVYHDAEMDHGFGRVGFMLEHIMECDWLLFMGADTLFMNMKSDIRQFCTDDADLVAAWDTMGLQSDSMLLRNCQKTIFFLQDVMAMKEETIKRPGFMNSSDQGAMVRLLSGSDSYFSEDRSFNEQVIPASACQKYGLRVKEAPRRINSYLDTFQIGDEIFHCPGMCLADKVRQTEIMLKQVIR